MTGKAGQTRKPAAKKDQKQSSRMGLLGAGVLVLFIAAGIALAVTDEPTPTKQEFAAVDISGDPLPPVPDNPADDTAVGMQAPVATGTNFDEEPVTLLNDDGGTVIVFLAHWCSHCRAEVPEIVDNFSPDSLPDGVRLVAVSTQASQSQPNWPPSAWLENADWPFPVLVDTSESTVSKTYGMRGTPYFVAVDKDGAVRFRASGRIGADQLAQVMEAVAP